MEDRCICCNEIVPEGRQICYNCEDALTKVVKWGKNILNSRLTAEQIAHEEDKITLLELLQGKWVESERVQRALGISYQHCVSLFEHSRIAEWWSIVGKTDEERARDGQCITIYFRVKIPKEER